MVAQFPERGPMIHGIHVLMCLALFAMLSFRRNQYELDAEYHQVQKSEKLQNTSTFVPTQEGTNSLVDWSWCPDAKCLVSPICDPCRRRFLIIITNGRSASTTLTWMLDTLPGVRMGGENNNAIQNIITMIDKTTAHPFQLHPSPFMKYGAWDHNPIPDGSLACMSQKIIETIVPPKLINATHLNPNEQDEIVGFKTIRLIWGSDSGRLPKIATFLKESFPCAKFIVNYCSDVEKQAKSQKNVFESHRKEELNVTMHRLSMEVGRLKNLADLLGNQSMTLDSTKWTADVGELNKVVRWLGFDDTCAFPKLLKLNTAFSMPKKGQAVKTSTTARAFMHTDTQMKLDPRCRYVGNLQ